MSTPLLKRVLQRAGIDTQPEKYAYGEDPRFGLTTESRIADKWVKTTCGYCSVGCGMLIGVKNGKAVAARGNPDHPVNRGKLCPKGLSEHHILEAPGRARTPLLRKDGILTPVPWEEALAVMIERVGAIQHTYGLKSSTRWANSSSLASARATTTATPRCVWPRLSPVTNCPSGRTARRVLTRIWSRPTSSC
jgi:assimilatory nitrate reductase catalytic subunit